MLYWVIVLFHLKETVIYSQIETNYRRGICCAYFISVSHINNINKIYLKEENSI